ncbi:MAG: NAD(+)/NADH kinase [Planctomycetia bacterium]|nr:NAD(+)/NADH kinase [Planctomycetia bacterium]
MKKTVHPYRTVLLLGNKKRHGVPEVLEKLVPQIAELYDIVDTDYSGTRDMSKIKVDFAIVFGGDGSLIRAFHQLGPNQVPLLAVHLGSLGFLSSTSSEELIPLLKRPDFSEFSIRHQILLECSLFRKRSQLTPENRKALDLPDQGEGDPDEEFCISKRLVVNEVALRGGSPFQILKIELLVDGDSVTTYHGDGLIISTPVGSTAHCLSAGGPILRKDLNAVVICPLNPHTLSNRPVIDGASREYELRVRNPNVFVVIDGEVDTTIGPGDRVLINQAPFTCKMIRIPGKSYYRSIREKLGWGGCIEGMENKVNR